MTQGPAALGTQSAPFTTSVAPDRASGTSFRELFNSIKGGAGKGDPFQELLGTEKILSSGKSIAPRELLTYQIKAGQFNLHAKLVEAN